MQETLVSRQSQKSRLKLGENNEQDVKISNAQIYPVGFVEAQNYFIILLFLCFKLKT